MADITRVKISELEEIRFSDVNNADQFVINDVSIVNNDDIATKRISFGGIIDYITKQDLHFKGNNLYENTIQPPVGKELNAVFDDVNIRRKLVIGPTTEVEGFNINTDADDVYIGNINNLEDDYILVWNWSVNSGDGAWVPADILDYAPIPEDAPKDGQIYARKDGEWVDITDCIDCTVYTIGDVNITNMSGDVINVDTPTVFRATITGNVRDLFYEWSVDSDTATISGEDDQDATITFAEPGPYVITCRVRSFRAIDSPVDGIYQFTIIEGIDSCRILIDPEPSDGPSAIQTEDFLFITRDDCVPLGKIIGNVTISEVTKVGGVIEFNGNGTYIARHDSSDFTTDELTYQWSSSSNQIQFGSPRQVLTTINILSPGTYNVSCSVSSSEASDSPVIGRTTVTLNMNIGSVNIARVGNSNTYIASAPNADSGLGNLTYRWTSSNASITFTNQNSRTTDVIIGSNLPAGNYNITCTVSSSLASDSPQSATTSVQVFTIGDVSVTRITTGDVLNGSTHRFTANITGNVGGLSYQWSTSPSNTGIVNGNSKTSTITFNSAGSHTITCRVTSAAANDSPRTGSITVSVEDTFRILRDPNRDKITTQDNRYLNWQS